MSKCERCGQDHGLYPDEAFALRRCAERLSTRLKIAKTALTTIKNAEMSTTQPFTVNAGVRLVAADALAAIDMKEDESSEEKIA